MIDRWIAKAPLRAALVLGLLSVPSAVGAVNTVPGTKVSRYQVAITANTLKPSTCNAITLTVVKTGAGTSSAELHLGTSAADVMSSSGGNDCVLGGGGNDSIDCGTGVDVAIGGPGTDTFNLNCETQIQ